MGDDRFGFDFGQYENVLEVLFASPADTDPSPLDSRRALEAAVRKIPDSALRGLKSFRITISTVAKKEG